MGEHSGWWMRGGDHRGKGRHKSGDKSGCGAGACVALLVGGSGLAAIIAQAIDLMTWA